MPTIYEHFAAHTKIPVYLKDVKNFVLNTGEVQVIARYPVDIDELVLHGMLRVFRDRPPYSQDDRVMAQIAYYKDLHPFEVRLVCCKEMLHLLDKHHATACDRDLVAKLVEEITLPIEAVASIPALTDHTKLLHALMILLPKAALDLLRPKYLEGQLSADDVSKIARVPEPWARVALSDVWAKVQEKFAE